MKFKGRRKKTCLILNADNNENRRQFETCIKKGKRILNPIIDWLDDDVWEFLNYYGCKSNPLYQCGFKRIGCIGCPMARKGRIMEFEKYPKYKNIYIKAFQRMVDKHGYAKKSGYWQSGEEVFDWWMNEKRTPKEFEGQISMFDDM